MQKREIRTENDQCLELVDHQSAAQQLQDVLSLRLSCFYGCAFRLLGNALTQRTRCRKPFWLRTNI